MQEQQDQMSQVQSNIPDERREVNTEQDEFSIANTDVHQEGLRRGIPEAKQSEVGNPQMNEEVASHDPRRQQGAEHRAGGGNQQGDQQPSFLGNSPRDQYQQQRHEVRLQDGHRRGGYGNQNRNWRQGECVQGGQPQFQARNIDDTMARRYGRLPR